MINKLLKNRRRRRLLLLVIVLVLAAFFRFVNLSKTVMFLDDQGRDVLKAAKILKEGDIPFIGPMASTGNLYLGPLYYWMITPFLWLFGYHPVGPVVMVALLGVAGCFLLFVILEKHLSLTAAFFGSVLYALSPLLVQTERFSWNPNPVPFFTLLWLFFLQYLWDEKKTFAAFGVGFALGVLIQLHYVTGLLFLVTFLVLLVWLWENRPSINIELIVRLLAWLVGGIIIPLLPFVMFEFKNAFINTRAGWQFLFSAKETGAVQSSWGGRVVKLMTKLLDQAWLVSKPFVLLGFAAASGLLVVWKSRRKFLPALTLAVLPVGLGLSALALSANEVHVHYIGFTFPFLFILLAVAFYFWQEHGFFFSLLIGLVGLLLLVNSFSRLCQDVVLTDSNRQVTRAQELAQYIIDNSDDENIFVTSLTGSPYAYPTRYYLYLQGVNGHEEEADELFALCEGGGCNPEGHPLWEIAQFGQLETIDQRHVAYGTWVYKLVPRD